jgi:hypothetical protein
MIILTPLTGGSPDDVEEGTFDKGWQIVPDISLQELPGRH